MMEAPTPLHLITRGGQKTRKQLGGHPQILSEQQFIDIVKNNPNKSYKIIRNIRKDGMDDPDEYEYGYNEWYDGSIEYIPEGDVNGDDDIFEFTIYDEDGDEIDSWHDIYSSLLEGPDNEALDYEWTNIKVGDSERDRLIFRGGKRRKKKTRKKKGGLHGPRELEEGRQYLYTGPEPHFMPEAELQIPVRITVTYRGRNVPGLTPNHHYFDGEREIAGDGHSLDIFSLDNAEIEQHIQPWVQNPGPPRVTNPSGVYAPRPRRESMCENCSIMGGARRRKKKTRKKRK